MWILNFRGKLPHSEKYSDPLAKQEHIVCNVFDTSWHGSYDVSTSLAHYKYEELNAKKIKHSVSHDLVSPFTLRV